jgi:hypothetical protein
MASLPAFTGESGGCPVGIIRSVPARIGHPGGARRSGVLVVEVEGFGRATGVPAVSYGVIMALSRRAQVTLGGVIAVLLGGMAGLALWSWWSWRHRAGGQPVARFRRVRVAVVAAGLVIITVGAVWRFAVAFQHTPACTPPGGAQAATRSGGFDVSLLAQQAATWPETGIGLLYSRVNNAHVCLSRAADYYVAVHANNPTGAKAMTVGDILLSPGFKVSKGQLRTLIDHEARHRAQWAVLTVIGGPLAFPVAYGIDDFFFPGARNHFERLAGLKAGGYAHGGTGPVLGPAQFAALGALAAIIAVALLAAGHRRATARSRSGTDPPAAGRDRGMTGGLTPDE